MLAYGEVDLTGVSASNLYGELRISIYTDQLLPGTEYYLYMGEGSNSYTGSAYDTSIGGYVYHWHYINATIGELDCHKLTLEWEA